MPQLPNRAAEAEHRLFLGRRGYAIRLLLQVAQPFAVPPGQGLYVALQIANTQEVQALLQSVQMQDAFGTSTEFVGLENFKRLFSDELYIESFRTTAVFSILVAVSGLSASRLRHLFVEQTGLPFKVYVLWTLVMFLTLGLLSLTLLANQDGGSLDDAELRELALDFSPLGEPPPDPAPIC